MKALLLQQAGPDYTLVPATVPIPTPGAGEVLLQITRIISLDEVPTALREAEAGHTQGKVVIRL
jgi:NADPH:quinone reductase-like Zn-dependent oxidoreductase